MEAERPPEHPVSQPAERDVSPPRQSEQQSFGFPDIVDRINHPEKYNLSIPAMHKPLIMAQANGIKREETPMTYAELVDKLQEHYDGSSGNGDKLTF